MASIAFLSRFPVPSRWLSSEINFEETCHTFPLAGLLIAFPSALMLWVFDFAGISPVVSSLIAVAALIIFTGALHEDGLADVADGFWGGKDKQSKLNIMRDSAVGTYGVLALILSVGLRVGLYAQLITGIGGLGAAIIFAVVASLSRLAMLQPWSSLPPARAMNAGVDGNGKDGAGLSARYGAPNNKTFLRAFVLALPVMFLMMIWFGGWQGLLALAIFQLTILASCKLSMKHIGGHTGDTLGATQQISELGLLLSLILTM